MTVKDYLAIDLCNKGFSSQQAVPCIDFCIPKIQKSLEDLDYKITFDRPCDEYPILVLKLITFNAKPFVLEWIEENIPNAWFKEMFKEISE